MHRLARARVSLLDKRPGDPVATDRRRFAFRDAGELWIQRCTCTDPRSATGASAERPTSIAFIDDATRVIPASPTFAHSENTKPDLSLLRVQTEDHRDDTP